MIEAIMETWPSLVNFTAFPMMLSIVCIRRFSSPIAYAGKSADRIRFVDSFFTDAIGFIREMTYRFKAFV